MERVKSGYYSAVAIPVDTEDGPRYAQLGLSKKSGTKQVLVSFKITDGEYKGVTLPWFGYFTAESQERTVKSLRMCGWEGATISSLLDAKLDAPVQVTVENNEYEGKTHSRVAWVNEVGGPIIKLERGLSDKDAKALEKVFGEF